jgi:putative ABC transport system permease protein
MGRILLVCRLAARDLRRRLTEAALLVLAITAATTTLTLGLVLHGVTDQPYHTTREATSGPDVIASVAPPLSADLAGLEAFAHAPGVIGHSGPYPVFVAELGVHGVKAAVWAEGRDAAPASIDQPKLTQGSWVGDGGVVVEAAFADALGVGEGDRITLNGRSFQVVGVAVTAAMLPYPKVCFAPCRFGAAAERALPDPEPEPLDGPVGAVPPPPPGDPGLIWLTEADTRKVARSAESLSYVLNLKLEDPAEAAAFVSAHSSNSVAAPFLQSWQDILDLHGNVVKNVQRGLLSGSWLLGLLAMASVSVLVGGRMADQIRRVGLLKAVGATPNLVAAVLLAEYVVVALLAAAAGLAAGWFTAPLLTAQSAGLLGSEGAPSLTLSTVGLVAAVALGVAAAATFVPALRAARTSTVLALADSARPARRTAWLVAISARLPVPLLLGLRVAARRPRSVVLGAVSIFVTVSGIVGVLAAHTQLYAEELDALGNLRITERFLYRDRFNQVLLVITVMLVALAAINVIFFTWTTALDARRPSALARALGATPWEVTAGLSAAQVLPALAGAVLGVLGGIGLVAALSETTTPPSLWSLLAVVPATVLVVAALTTIPARFGAHRPAAEALQSERA